MAYWRVLLLTPECSVLAASILLYNKISLTVIVILHKYHTDEFLPKNISVTEKAVLIRKINSILFSEARNQWKYFKYMPSVVKNDGEN